MAVIYHSHVDAGAYFSPTDRKQALVSGYLDQVYLVTSVVSGRVEATKAFCWDAGPGEFVETELVIGRPGAAGSEWQLSTEATR